MAYLYIDLQFWFCVITREKVAAHSVGGEQECKERRLLCSQLTKMK